MRIFGLDIQRCSKTDSNQEQVYKTVVRELYDRLVAYLECMSVMINDETEVEEDAAIQLMFEHVETISKLIIVYQENKFSIPLTSISIVQRLEIIRVASGQLRRMMLYHINTQSRMNQYEPDDDEKDEYNTIQSQFHDTDEKYYQQRKHMCKVIFGHINAMLSVIQYDLFKVIFGVDIIRDYYSNKRRHGKPAFMVKIYQNLKPNKEETL